MSSELGAESAASSCLPFSLKDRHGAKIHNNMIFNLSHQHLVISLELLLIELKCCCVGCKQPVVGLCWAAGTGTAGAFLHGGFLRGSLGLKFLKFCVFAIILESDPSTPVYISTQPTLHPGPTQPCWLNRSDVLNGGGKLWGLHTIKNSRMECIKLGGLWLIALCVIFFPLIKYLSMNISQGYGLYWHL